ncbi:dethiobiotin synthase [Rheinheimera sp.]|uniref:dethiobiotin synthase n=1 Tax=Rheinheimera sp. TaxID=1869214 RepID=UPI00307EF350
MKIFVTGTDTDAGKTYCTTALLGGLQQRQLKALGLKPFAAGVNSQGQNTDALALQQASTVPLSYHEVNPVCLPEAIAPHLAAAHLGQQLSKKQLTDAVARVDAYQADLMLIEGAGGWMLPVTADACLSDWVAAQGWPVILVVGMKLGCLNHALLTVNALQQAGVPLLGWIANCIDPDMLCLDENIATLQQRILAPCLAVLPYAATGVSPDLQLQLADAVLNYRQSCR